MVITNSMIAKIKAVQIAGDSFKNSNILKDKKAEIENFLVSFDDIIKKSNEVYKSFISVKLICNNLSCDIQLLQKNIETLKSKVKIDDYDKSNINIIKKEIEKINTEILKTWKLYISEKTSAIDNFLTIFGNVIADTPEKKVLDMKKYVFTSQPMGSSVALSAIKEYISTYEILISKLNLSDEVTNFFKIITTGNKVTLKDMNLEVFEWISSSGFADKINIKL